MAGIIELKNQNGQKAALSCKKDGTNIRMSELGITDPNDLKTSGRYVVTTTCSNTPVDGWMFVDVWAFNGNEVIQEVISWRKPIKKYIRLRNVSGVWNDWEEE